MIHDTECSRRVDVVETDQFAGMVHRWDHSDTSYLVLGAVSRGYPTVKERKGKIGFFYESETTPSRPWSVTVWVPNHLKEALIKQLGHAGTACTRIGPFRTRQEALQGLEDFWLKRLGAM